MSFCTTSSKFLSILRFSNSVPRISSQFGPHSIFSMRWPEISEHQPVARPRSLISGQRMEKIEWGPNWEEILSTEVGKRRKDKHLDKVQADIDGQYEDGRGA